MQESKNKSFLKALLPSFTASTLHFFWIVYAKMNLLKLRYFNEQVNCPAASDYREHNLDSQN